MQHDTAPRGESGFSPIDQGTVSAARAFLREIEGRYAVRDVYLFGSRARGTHRSDSDIDLAVILRGGGGDRSAIIVDISGVAVEVLMDHDVLIQALPLWEGEFDLPDTFRNPALIQNIRRDGLRL